jgi:hypothetical protein
MKKILIVLVLIAVIILASIQLFKGPRATESAAALVPQDTVLFLEFPDLEQTAAGWQQSPMGQMLVDEALRPFWQRPLAELFAGEEWKTACSLLATLKTKSIFLAATFAETGTPQILLGFQAASGAEGMNAVLQRLHDEVTANGGTGPEAWSNGGASGLRQSWNDSTMWTGVLNGWGVIANSEKGLGDFLVRIQGGQSETSLHNSENFRKTIVSLGMDQPDVLMYMSPAEVMRQLREFATAQGAVPISQQFDQLEQWETLAFAVKMSADGVTEKAVAWTTDGAPIHTGSGLAEFATRFAPADTLFLTSLVWEPATQLTAIWPSLPPEFLQVMEYSGIDPTNVSNSLGDKVSLALWWPGGSLLPSALAVTEIKDPDAFGSLAGKLGGLLAGETTIDSSGTLTTMTFRADALGLVSPTMAYRESHGFLAMNPGDIALALATEESGGGLAKGETWKKASPFLSKGSIQLTLVDVPGIVRRAYATFQPMLGFAAAMNPQVSRYADFSRLPEADALVRHLGPVLARREAIPGGGVRTEINGPVTWSSLLLALPAGLADGFSHLNSIAEE